MLVEPHEGLPPHAICSKDQSWNLKPLSGSCCDPMILQPLQIQRKIVEFLVPKLDSLVVNLGYPHQVEIIGRQIPIREDGIVRAKCFVVNAANVTVAVLDVH